MKNTKKILITIPIILLFLTLNANSQSLEKAGPRSNITFSYDTAGNQIKRCFDCSSDTDQQEENIEQVKIENEKQNTLNYYPNPVKNELLINWNTVSVLTIQVYNINNKLLAIYKINEKVFEFEVPFSNYAAGTYIVKILFTNNNKEILKIIKI